MKTNSGRMILTVVLMAAALPGVYAASATGATIEQLIWVIERPAPPAEPPDWMTISRETWTRRRDEVWVEKRLDAQKQLSATGAPAVQPLLDLMKRAPQDSVRIVALTALSAMTDRRALKPAGGNLAELLKDKNAGVRYLAVKTLGLMRHRAAVPQIEKLLEEPEESVRQAAVLAMGQIGDARSAVKLVKLTDEKDQGLRLHAIEALGMVGVALVDGEPPGGVTDVVAKVIPMLGANDPTEEKSAVFAFNGLTGWDLTSAAEWILVQTKPKDKAAFVGGLEAWWKGVRAGRGFVVPNAPELTLRVNMAANRDLATPVRVRAVGVMKSLEDPRAVNYLVIIMADPDKDIRRAAAEAAEALSGIRIEYLPADSETTWAEKVERFRRNWDERSSGR